MKKPFSVRVVLVAGIFAAGKLGTSISDMQTHLDALNKNLEMLKQIKGMLGG